jgi:integrase
MRTEEFKHHRADPQHYNKPGIDLYAAACFASAYAFERTGRSSARTLLDSLTPIVIEKYKIDRRSRLKNGGSIALDMAVLHLMFAFAVQKGLMAKNCINGKNETKPGKKPKAPAHPLNADELQKLRDNAGNDMLAFLLLRWTGLRGNDAVNLTWSAVRFDQGENGEIEVMTQKRRKLAVVPMSTELRTALEAVMQPAKQSSDFVLVNPYTKVAYSKGDASTSDAGRKK